MNDFLVYLVDDDVEVASAIALLVSSVGLKVSAFSSAQEFLAAYEPDIPSCLILDVRMPGMNGLDLQNMMISGQVTVPTIFVTGHGDIPTAVRAIKQGAIDVLEKPFNDQVLLDCVFEAKKKDAEWRLERRQATEISHKVKALTNRERQVLVRVTQGALNKVIASDLGLSIRTVELHRANIMKKLEARSVADLVKMTLRSPALIDEKH